MHLPEYRNSICGLPSRLTGCIPSCECASKRGETEVTGSTVGLVPTNALVSGGGSLFTDWPETGFAETSAGSAFDRTTLPPSRLGTDRRNIRSRQHPSLARIERSRSGKVRHLRRHARMHRGRLASVVDHAADPAVIAQRQCDHVVESYLGALRRLDCPGQ